MIINSALYLASRGFHVFPLRPGTKRPARRGWCEDATCDLTRVEAIWTKNPEFNVGISTSWYTNGELWHALAIDVDNKNGKNGTRSAIELGSLLPETFVQRTPSGGYHYIYKSRVATASPVGLLGEGLDARGWHTLVVGAGSIVALGQYTIALSGEVVEAPAGLVDLIGEADTRERVHTSGEDAKRVRGLLDETSAVGWAAAFLSSLPIAATGTINNSAFKAAAALRDRGLLPEDIYGLMLDGFKSELPMDEDEIWGIANHVHKYAKNAPGSRAPEVLFEAHLKSDAPEEAPVMPADGSPIEWFNQEHTVCLIGSACYVIKRSKDSWGKPVLDIMGVDAFHTMYAGCTFQTGEGKVIPMSRAWMASKYRSTHFGLAFAPGRELPPTHYNLWQGFAYEPRPVGSERDHRTLENWKRHMLHNMCRGDKDRAHHVTAWFAQMYQQPQVKAVTSLVIRGEKGSGKDTMLDIIGAPLGAHYMLTAQGSDLTGQFNSALESRLLIVYNEAFWAHDHKAEAVLKQLVTGRKLRIERKGCEPYFVDNLSRTVIMGNDAVQVPASIKERRWFVIDMRDIPDSEQEAHIAFCTELREGMEAGGYHLLVDYLLNYDISGVNLGIAPNSEGLVEAKMAGLPPVHLWFHECLLAGAIVGSGVPTGWPDKIDKKAFRDAFRRWKDESDIAGRIPSDNMFGRQLTDLKMGIQGDQKTKDGKSAYMLPKLEDARKGWDILIKAVKETKW